jgi:hypothetical protein
MPLLLLACHSVRRPGPHARERLFGTARVDAWMIATEPAAARADDDDEPSCGGHCHRHSCTARWLGRSMHGMGDQHGGVSGESSPCFWPRRACMGQRPRDLCSATRLLCCRPCSDSLMGIMGYATPRGAELERRVHTFRLSSFNLLCPLFSLHRSPNYIDPIPIPTEITDRLTFSKNSLFGFALISLNC